MGRSGNTAWGISNYFGLPNRKRKLLTKEFLQDFKDEVIKIDKEYNKKYNRPELDYENETYMGFYGEIESSYLFYKALKIACEKHNVVKAIYQYAEKLTWYDSDYFDSSLTSEMINKGIIKYDRPEDYTFYNDETEHSPKEYKLVQHFKGYDVVEFKRCFSGSEKRLEDIYSDGDYELIWLNSKGDITNE